MARSTKPEPEPVEDVAETAPPAVAVNADTGEVTPAGEPLPPVAPDAYPEDAVELVDEPEDEPEDVTGRPIFPAGWDR